MLTQDEMFGDLIDAVIKYYKVDGIDNRKQLIRVAKESYSIREKRMQDDALLVRAGRYAAEAEQEFGNDVHPKTASFNGFIAGYIEAKTDNGNVEKQVSV